MPDFEELPVAGEGTATEIFSYVPDFEIQTEEQFSGFRQEFEAGYEQTFPRFSKTRRAWSLKFNYRSETEKNLITGFIEARVGGEEAFYWTPEDETSPVKVYIKSDTIAITKINPDIWDISFEVEELT